jgi:hypothetical protein
MFCIVDPTDKMWHIILLRKRWIVGVGNVVDEEEYDHFDKIPLFSTGIEVVPVINNEKINYLRSDHEEGVWVQRRKSE